MASERTIWTVLPFRKADNRLAVAVHVSPRLTPEDGAGKLGQFPTWEIWPDTINPLTLELEFEHGPERLQVSLAEDAWRADRELWGQLFDGQMPVNPFTFADQSQRLVHSFPVGAVRRHIEDEYRRIAANCATDFPLLEGSGADGLQGLLAAIGNVHKSYARYDNGRLREPLARWRDEARRSGRAARLELSNPPVEEPELGLFQVLDFYSRARLQDPPGTYPPIEKPRLDFHRALALLADHPTLSERLGLVQILDGEDPGVSTESAVRLRSETLPAGAVCPWTEYLLRGPRFLPRPRTQDGAVGHGFLKLDEADLFDFHQLDVDGAALKLIQFASGLADVRQQDKNFATPARESVPALRSAGLTVSMNGRGAELMRRFEHNRQLNDLLEHDDARLWADDVVRGYRLDVWDGADGVWRSLHRRSAPYALGPDGKNVWVEHEEGYVKGATATVAGKDDASADMYAHEALFGWEGWSLSAPRPGKTIPADPSQIKPQKPEAAAFDELPLLSERWAFPASLPRLRYGRSYRLRARTVDLAGRGLPHTDTDDRHATAVATYRRFEPVQGPAFLRRHYDTEGESLERLVIRSDVGTSAAEYAKFHHDRYPPASERHVAAPKVSQLVVEQHGLFDADAFDGDDPAAAYSVARKEAGSFASPKFWDPVAGAEVDVEGIQWIPGVPAPTGGAPPQPGQYMFNRSRSVRLPYLPDPLAAGVVFFGLPGADPEEPFVAKWEAPVWHDPRPFRLVLLDDEVPPYFRGHELVVGLPPAEVARVRVSSYLDPKHLGLMGIWALLDPLERSAVMDAARRGRHWMLTPYREVTLVHAVQRPLRRPQVEVDRTERGPGDTWAAHHARITCHAASSGRVDVDARWNEHLDLLSEPAPRTAETHARPAAYDVPEGQDVIKLEGNNLLRHEFGDTKHRRVTYSAIATTRFREYFPHEITQDADNITQTSEAVTVDVPSSARPAAPVVRQELPTFEWIDERDDPDVKVRTRRGNGVRVYLERPWYSSGRGEELAVLLRTPRPEPIPGEEEALRPYVSDWGTDPVWRAAAPSRPLRPGHFPARSKRRRGQSEPAAETLEELPQKLSPEEFGGGMTLRVTPVPHPVHFDEERRLWYCDIDLRSRNTYMPFVRLALARYQRSSVPNCHLSRVVLTDFLSLQPDRTATLEFRGDNLVEVTLSGPYGQNRLGRQTTVRGGNELDAFVGGRLVEVVLERDFSGTGDELAWTPVADAVLHATGIVAGKATWSGKLALRDGVRGNDAYSILVVEHERYHSDAETAEEIEAGEVPVRSRIVYADRFRLT